MIYSKLHSHYNKLRGARCGLATRRSSTPLSGPSLFSRGSRFSMNEIWKDAVGYEDRYEVSSMGRVRSKTRVESSGKTRRGKIFKPSSGHHGYQSVTFTVEKNRKSFRVHRLVTGAFLGDIGNLEVDHINGDQSDNRIDNLQYISRTQNVRKHHTGNPNETSKYLGVFFHRGRGKWCAKGTASMGNIYLGEFSSELLAHRAFSEKMIEMES